MLGYAKHEGQMDTLSWGCNSKDLLFKASDSNSGRTDQHFVPSKAADFPLYFSALMLPRPELLSPNHFPALTQGLHCPRAGHYNSFKTVTYFIAGLILQYVRKPCSGPNPRNYDLIWKKRFFSTALVLSFAVNFPILLLKCELYEAKNSDSFAQDYLVFSQYLINILKELIMPVRPDFSMLIY